MNGGGHMGYMGWMNVWWIIALALIAVVIWALLRPTRGPGASIGPGESPEDVVKRRYARGEIDRETYRRMLDDLKGRDVT